MRYSAPIILRIPKLRFGNNKFNRKFILFLVFISLLALSSLIKTKYFPPPKEASAQVSCTNRPAAFTILLDRSGSMGADNKLANARNASISFINRLKGYTTTPVSYAGAISISNSAEAVPQDQLPWTKLEWRLTQYYDNVIDALNKLTTVGGATCISCAIKLSNEQFSLYSSDGRRKNVVILITDGGATKSLDGHLDTSDAWDEAMTYAQQSVSQYNATYFVINIDPNTGSYDLRRMNDLVNLNTSQPGKYFLKDSSNIDSALDEIFKVYGTASISGYKYNDTDRDGNFDNTESGLANWNIRLNQTGQFTRSTTTDSTGKYRFDEVCDGDYTLSEVQQAGWDLTNPSNNSIPVAIRNLISVQNRNFGNVQNPPIHTIQGTVFIDNNSDNSYNTGDTTYQGVATINYRLVGPGTLWQTKTTSTGSYSLTGLVRGQYDVQLEAISSYTPYPLGRTFRVTVGSGCAFPSIALDASCNASDNITGLNFGLSVKNSWIQTTGLDVRWDGGWTNNIPSGASCSSEASVIDSSSTPGVIVSGDKDSDFTPGKASFKEWLVGNPTYKEKYSKTGRLQTSYTSMLSTIQKSGTEIVPINHPTLGACADPNSCTLIGSTANGAFSVEGDLRISAGRIDTAETTQTVILVNGDVFIDGDIQVKDGNFLMVIASGKIIVNKLLGNTTPSCSSSVTPDIEGVFVSDSDFDIPGNNNCQIGADRMLTLAGTVVVNAERNGGSFNNGRNLCDNNANFPSVKVRERPDFILNAPYYIQSQSTIWKEVAP